MLPLSHQPAGLPSGSFGGRSRRSAVAARHRTPSARASASRLLMRAAAGLMALTVLWWLALLVASVVDGGPPWAVSAAMARVLVPAQGATPLLLLWLAFGLAPRWLGLNPPASGLLQVPVVLLSVGSLLGLVGCLVSPLVVGLGLALQAVGLALAAGLYGLMALETASPARRHAWAVTLGTLLAALGLWATALALVLQRGAASPVWAAALLWAGPAVVLAAVLHREAPRLR